MVPAASRSAIRVFFIFVIFILSIFIVISIVREREPEHSTTGGLGTRHRPGRRGYTGPAVITVSEPVVLTVPAQGAQGRAYRLASIDMLRGLVIVIMAIDHVRDFFNFGGEADPMANPDIGAALFFTRWITHFCAPVFVFLAGTSAGLMTSRKTPSALGAFLFTRGLWLIFVECVVVATAWSFAPVGHRAARRARSAW